MTRRKFQTSAEVMLDRGLYLTRLQIASAMPMGMSTHTIRGCRHMIIQKTSEEAMLHAPAVATRETLEDGVHLDDGDVSAGTGGLVLALAGDPGLEGLQLLPERADLHVSIENSSTSAQGGSNPQTQWHTAEMLSCITPCGRGSTPGGHPRRRRTCPWCSRAPCTASSQRPHKAQNSSSRAGRDTFGRQGVTRRVSGVGLGASG